MSVPKKVIITSKIDGTQTYFDLEVKGAEGRDARSVLICLMSAAIAVATEAEIPNNTLHDMIDQSVDYISEITRFRDSY